MALMALASMRPDTKLISKYSKAYQLPISCVIARVNRAIGSQLGAAWQKPGPKQSAMVGRQS
jgi:hypothetical protein